ncbi:MAG: C40 family peptidase [Thermodesulfobacteriota bacterium]
MTIHQKRFGWLGFWVLLCIIAVFHSSDSCAMEENAFSILDAYGLSDEAFENHIQKYIGIPYRRNGTSQKGMDCSGFVSQFYRSLFDINLPHNSLAQYRFSMLHTVDEDDMQPGDLVFFKHPKSNRINHVGVYLSDGQFVHASSSEGVTVSSLDEGYWKKRFVGSKRFMAFNRRGSAETVSWESQLEMPLGPRSSLKLSAQNEFQYDDTADTPSLLPPMLGLQPSFPATDTQHTFRVGVDYGIHLADATCSVHVGAIQESLHPHHAWLNPSDFQISGIDFRPDLPPKFRYDPLTALPRTGYKLSSDFQASPWLTISPGLLVYDYPEDRWQGYDVPKRVFSLNTHFNPEGNRYYLKMGIQYADQEDAARMSLSESLNSIDMAIRLGINLSDRLQFNVISQQDFRSRSFEWNDSTLPAQHDVYMGFDFHY